MPLVKLMEYLSFMTFSTVSLVDVNWNATIF